MQEIVDNIDQSYKVSTKQFKTKTNLEPIIFNNLSALFRITFDMIIGDTEERILLQDDEDKLVVKSVGQKFIVNDREIETVFGGRHVYEIVNKNGFISVSIDGVEHITDIEGFSEPLNELQLFPDNIVGAIYSIKYVDITNILLQQTLHNFVAVYDVKNNKVGILDLYTTTFYEDTNGAIKKYAALLSYIRGTGTQWLETDFIPNHDTKYEIKITSNYSTDSSTCFFGADNSWASSNVIWNNQGSATKMGWFYPTTAVQWTESSQYSTRTFTFYRGTVTRNGTIINTNNNKNTNVVFRKLRLFKGQTRFCLWSILFILF